MPKYFYVCPKCGHEYLEVRTVEESQYFTRCNSCKEDDYNLVLEEVASE